MQMTHWIFLWIAGALEIGWMVSLKLTHGFTRVIPIIFYALFGLGSAFCLSRALKGGIPIAVAYPIWMGIAFVGATLIDHFAFKERYESMQVVSIALIVVGITGLQISSRKAEENKQRNLQSSPPQALGWKSPTS